MPNQSEWDTLDDAAMRLDDALNIIGAPGKTDHDLAKIIVDNELMLRKLVAHVLAESTNAAQP